MTNTDKTDNKNELTQIMLKKEENVSAAEDLSRDIKFDEKKERLKKYSQDKEEIIAEVNLKTALNSFRASSQSLIDDLKATAEDIQKESFFLSSLPEKIGEQLLSSVPQISEALHKRVFDDLDKEIDRVGARIDELSAKSDKWLNCYDKRITEACAKFEEKTTSINMVLQNIQTTTLKKKILSYITSTLFLFAIALSACALAFKYFPSKVNINEGNNITVQSSDVTVWGKDFKIIEKIREREGSRSVKQLK